MTGHELTDEICLEAVNALMAHGSKASTARFLGIPVTTFKGRLNRAAARGFMGYTPVLPGFQLKETAAELDKDGHVTKQWVRQQKESGEEFEVPVGHVVKGVSALIDQEDRVLAKWVKTREDTAQSLETLRIVVDELKQELPKIKPSKAPRHCNKMLANQYTVTDSHFGMLSWHEETGNRDYDLAIAEKTLLDWFSAAIEMSPPAQVGIFSQLGDLLHHDSLLSVTPTHGHVLDADSRLQKIIRVVIRTIKKIIQMLLAKHEKVHIVQVRGNHDPASSCWLKELLASMYEDEPRITVDVSPDSYHCYEFGDVALFYHHGDKRKLENVDSVFAGKFKEVYGRSTKAYGHIGHLHSASKKETNLMLIERHRTLAPPDAHASGGGWLSQQDATVITYHRHHGEVSRITISPQMLEQMENE